MAKTCCPLTAGLAPYFGGEGDGMAVRKSTTRVEGKSFSKREISETTDESGATFYLEKLNFDDAFDIERQGANARLVLEKYGLDVATLLKDSPHGSALRDHVLNYLGLERDSPEGLSARIYELCRHIQAYKSIEGGAGLIPGLSYRLGRLVDIQNVYRVQSDGQKIRAKKPRKKNLLTQKIISTLARHRGQGLTLLEALRSMKNDDRGLRLVDIPDSNEYLVIFDNPDGELMEKKYKLTALQDLFTPKKKN
jgi:hypothetical protein